MHWRSLPLLLQQRQGPRGGKTSIEMQSKWRVQFLSSSTASSRTTPYPLKSGDRGAHTHDSMPRNSVRCRGGTFMVYEPPVVQYQGALSDILRGLFPVPRRERRGMDRRI